MTGTTPVTEFLPVAALKGQELDLVILGAGIVGLAAAHKLQQAGRAVTLIDRKGIALETSRGNAGGFAFTDILPLASSGKIARVPRWLLDPLGPLSVPPAYLPRILPWLIRFWRAGWPDRLKASIAAQSAMMRLASREMERMIEAAGLKPFVGQDGALELYESEAEFAASARGWQARQAEGIAFEHVRGDRLAELQPGLAPRFRIGTFTPTWRTVTDPYDFASALAADLARRGARFATGEALALRPEGGGVRIELAGGRQISARGAVICTGAWSKHLACALGDPVPLETERGYNTTLPASAFDLRQYLIFGGHGFVISPLESGIRIGGAVELGGLNRAPDFRRAAAMLAKAAAFLPGLKTEGGSQWMGFRPSLPDSLPVIGASRAGRQIVYAFGHGHLGLTQSAGTGRLVADLVTGRPPEIDLAPFNPRRFYR